MREQVPMSAKKIREELNNRNIAQAGLARDLDEAPSVISQVIDGKTISYRVQCHIAKALGKPVNKVFLLKSDPTKKGRPLGQGLLNRQESLAA